MTACLPRSVDLCAACRIHVSWPVTGVDGTTQAKVSLEGGTWIDLGMAPDFATVIGYFAGPDFMNPGAATVVRNTSHARVRIITPSEDLVFDGGFIRIRG